MGRLGSRLPPVNVPDWKVLAHHEDEDTGTALDFDTGTIPVHDLYKIVVSYLDHSGLDNWAMMRVNANSTANYNSVQFSGAAALEQRTGDDRWYNVGRSTDSQAAIVVFTLKGRTLTGDAFWPVIGNKSVQIYSEQQLIRGELRDPVSEVNRIRWWSDKAATGSVTVYGRNLPT